MIRTPPVMTRSHDSLPARTMPNVTITDPRITHSKIVPPFDLRFIRWTHHQIVTPRRIVRFLLWGFRIATYMYLMPRSFLAAELGPRVGDSDYEERNQICAMCESRTGDYCKSCHCPKWPLARLRHKNRLKNWLCPKQRHPGDYPQYGCVGCSSNTRGGDNGKDNLLDGRG